MKVTVVECSCSSTRFHRKLQDEEGNQTEGIFSLSQGRSILTELKECGYLNDDDFAETDAAMVAAGLPEVSSNSDEDLNAIAAMIILAVPAEDREKIVDLNVQKGVIRPEDADRLRRMVCQVREEVPAP